MTTDKTVKTLLDSASIQQCEKFAEKADIKGKRAKALLALNNGDTNSVAAEKSGLTDGQVNYLLNRFKKVGMEMFNASSVKKAVVKKAATKKSVTKKAAAKKAAPAASKPVINKTKSAPVSESTETTDSTETNKGESDSDSKKDKKKKSKKSSNKGKDKKGKKAKKVSKKDKKGNKKSK